MALTFSNLTADYDSSGATTSSTVASCAIKKNQLVVCTVFNKAGADPTAVTIAGLALTKITSISDGWSPYFLSVWRGMAGADATATGSIDKASAVSRWSVDMSNTEVDTSGSNGSGAIVQALTAAAATKTLATLGSANNAAFGCVSSEQTTAITVGSGYTQLAVSNAADGSAIATEYKINATVVNATTTTHPAIIALEVKAGAAGAGVVPFALGTTGGIRELSGGVQ